MITITILCTLPSAAVANGVAVIIDRDALALVGTGSQSCPDSRVSFVSRGGRVHAVCDAPAPVVAEVPVELPPVVLQEPIAPPEPEWQIVEGQSIQAAIRNWLPEGWRLAWDTDSSPLAAGGFKHVGGDGMGAIAELFDRRGVWGSTTLTACAFPQEQILQVRESGACGAP